MPTLEYKSTNGAKELFLTYGDHVLTISPEHKPQFLLLTVTCPTLHFLDDGAIVDRDFENKRCIREEVILHSEIIWEWLLENDLNNYIKKWEFYSI